LRPLTDEGRRTAGSRSDACPGMEPPSCQTPAALTTRGNLSDLEALGSDVETTMWSDLQVGELYRTTVEAQVLNEQLNHAWNSGIVTEQAEGMVAPREGVDMEQAFATSRAPTAPTACGWRTSPAWSSPASWPRPRRPSADSV
jgi:hypothetical protein